MRIFEKDEKTNFVDENNLFVGYDTSQHCCEDFGWAIVEKLPWVDILDPKLHIEQNGVAYTYEFSLENYRFDPAFIRKFTQETDGYGSSSQGGFVVFKLDDVTKGDPELYLVLWNFHTGFYSHGFEYKMQENQKESIEGSL